MPEYQLIEKNENDAKRNFFDFVCFRSGLTIINLNLLFIWENTQSLHFVQKQRNSYFEEYYFDKLEP